MAARRLRTPLIKGLLFGLLILFLLLLVSGLTLFLLDSLGITDSRAALTAWQNRILPAGGKEGEEEKPVDAGHDNDREKELHELRQENSQLRGELAQKGEEILSLLAELGEYRAKEQKWEEEQQRQIVLADIYSEMRPREAAPILARLSDQEALEILLLLDPRQAGEILAQMDAARAASLTQAINSRERR